MLSKIEFKKLIFVIALAAPLIVFGVQALKRPDVTNSEFQSVFAGVTYLQGRGFKDRTVSYHLVMIDLGSARVQPVLTPPCEATPDHFCAKTVSDFVKDHELQLAINASYFYPFKEDAFWDFAPRAGDKVKPVGLAITDGVLINPGKSGVPSLCFHERHATMQKDGMCPAGTKNAIAGRVLIEKANLKPNRKYAARTYPLNLVGLNQKGTVLFLLIVDGKQPFYSDGLLPNEGAELLFQYGAVRVLQLDGGGSTTLVMSDNGTPRIMNAVIHTRIPGRERRVANHLGFLLQPISDAGFAITNSAQD